MSFTNQTTHYGLPQWIGSDKPTYLVDQNNAYQKIDAEIYNANTTAGAAQTAAEGAVATAGAASSTAADALTAAQTASSTADNALTEAQTANTNAQAAQTAAGAAQTAAQAAQEAAAGNSITNLAPAYDPTITYNVDDLVTAEGKLYKCIVAVTSPEQFDINKWDDVTTSEVYLRQASVETRLKKVGMNDNSNFTFSNANDYLVLESRADNGKVRAILFDVQNNLLKLRKSDDNGVTFEDTKLFPTFRSGESKGFYGWSICQIVGTSNNIQLVFNFAAPFLYAGDHYTVAKDGAMAFIKSDASVWTDRIVIQDADITDITCVTGDGNIAVAITTSQSNIVNYIGKTVLSNYRFTLTKS